MTRGREHVGREAERVVVEVVVIDVRGVPVGARVAAIVVMGVAVADLLAVAELGVVLLVAARGGLGARAGVQARVARARGVAVLHQPVVLDEREHAVPAGVVGLEPVEQVAVALENVDVVLVRVADGEVAQHEAVGAVGEDAHVLAGPDARGAAVAGRRVAGVDDHVVGADS